MNNTFHFHLPTLIKGNFNSGYIINFLIMLNADKFVKEPSILTKEERNTLKWIDIFAAIYIINFHKLMEHL